MGEHPKYKVGEKVRVENWTETTEPLEILEVKKTIHMRTKDRCWGYRMNGDTGLTMLYVPEGYLRPSIMEANIGNLLLAAVLHPDSDVDSDLHHEEINEAEKRECRYCGDKTNTLEDGCCYTCYRQHCR